MYSRRFRTQYRSNRFSRFGSRHQSRFGRVGNIHEYIRKARQKKVLPAQAGDVLPIPVDEVLFSSLDLPENLKTTIIGRGYTKLTPIQAQGIPAIRDGKDVIGIANTGTGKTAAFLIPLIEKIIKDKSYRALILSPTRELALQIRDELRKFSGNLPIRSAFCIGQSSMRDQIYQINQNPSVVVGTPGRLKDLIKRGVLELGNFKMVIFDETDRMLDMGFIHDIKEIISYLPPVRQSLFFSATVSPVISRLIQSLVKNPVTISVKTQETVSHIRQDIVRLENSISKMEKLTSLLREKEFSKVLVFGRTKFGVERLSRDLFQKGFKVISIHGDKPQFKRQQAIRMFKEDVVNIMVATDVASRGLDISNVSHVINYDIPMTYEDYIHRIGRTGRANTPGTALTFVED